MEKRLSVSLILLCVSHFLAIFNSAYQCTHCLKFCHKQCCDTADSMFPCTGKPDSNINQEGIFRAFPVNHTLAENSLNFFENFMKPAFFKKEGAETQMQPMPSYRARPTEPEADDDSDAESLTSSSNNGASNSVDIDASLRRSSFLEGSPVMQDDRTLALYSQESKLLSRPGFLTVIIQQATNISLPVEPLLPIDCRARRTSVSTARCVFFPGARRPIAPARRRQTKGFPTGTVTTTPFP